MNGYITAHEEMTHTSPHFQPSPPRRILVVDEDSDLRLLYASVLAQRGYHVDVASDGVAGWEALQANRYHLMITENDLPFLTGVDLVKKLRAEGMDLPVVMAAGRLPTPQLARNPWLRIAATLWKPFVVEDLLDIVEMVLRETDSPCEESAPLPNRRSQPLSGSPRVVA